MSLSSLVLFLNSWCVPILPHGLQHLPRSLPAARYRKSIVGLFVGNDQTAPFYRLKSKGIGGAGGIRTLDTLLAYTHFPGERLRPLGHRSACLEWGALAGAGGFRKARCGGRVGG